jgi:hypothetical protein
VSNEFYRKLVDLYAGRELPAELEDQMELAAFQDPELSHDMATMRRTVDALQSDSGPEFTEESYQRILMKLYARGIPAQVTTEAPAHIQYHLPMRMN